MEKSQNRISISSHPYLLLILGCILLYIAFPLGNSDNILENRSMILLIIPLAATAVGFLLFHHTKPAEKASNNTSNGWMAAVGVCLAICCVCLLYLLANSPFQLEMLALLALLALAATALWFYLNDKFSARLACVLLGAAAFVLRAVYILYTDYLTRQHDVSYIQDDFGHQAYMLYLVTHNFALPDFDPRSVWEFYHPPLHYFLCALWIRLQLQFGTEIETAVENVQFLTLFASCAVLIISYRILRLLHFDGAALVIPFALLCFHPSLMILSGSINNDMLCILLSFAAILYAVRWYQQPTGKNIVLLAACIGFSMMAKSSGALTAPAVAVIFLIKLRQSKGHRAALWKQFLLFFAVCIPLGMWWSIYCKMRFGIPFGAVSGLKPDNPQYVGNYSPAERFFGIDWQHRSVFEHWDWKNHIFEYNLFVALLKTSMFDEAWLFHSGSGLKCAQMLFYVNIVIVISSLVCMAAAVVRTMCDRHHNRPYATFFLTLYITYLAFYIWFCFKEPYACTQSFRYIVPTVLLGGIGIGTVLKHIRSVPKRSAEIFTWAATILTGTFCVLSSAVYLLAGCVIE
ncbi:MAG: glycosyltransferase family 39 protein [Oscillospiraceae bacterium]|jgi:hypothetical protein|nr:glycosyltransferase family 39 protein [Oscillospiraceae bacterium]